MPQICEEIQYCARLPYQWIKAFPMQDHSSETIAKLLVDHVICHGVPNQLLSDQGMNLLSDLILHQLTGMKN